MLLLQTASPAILDVVLIAILNSFFTVRFICLYVNVSSLSVRPKSWRACTIFLVHPFFSVALAFLRTWDGINFLLSKVLQQMQEAQTSSENAGHMESTTHLSEEQYC